MSKVLRIGITGGIAAGKSTVSRHIRELGFVVIDYDELAYEISQPGQPVLEQIREAFDADSLNADGSMNRIWMAEHVFSSAQDLEQLNAILHPAVYARAAGVERNAVEAGCDVIFHDVPLLVETRDIACAHGLQWNHIMTIEADDDVRIQRMINTRHMTRQQAQARIHAQLGRAEREAVADISIDSSQPMDVMFAHIDHIIQRWLDERAAQTPSIHSIA
ncbi:dephospho-CoA kinase [Alloscardovia omnicolens]|uniref:dephospho-CoA kinase n=1 Tax=Alloscardovia omnicolens TaxID=419015 RepID=UPI003A67EC62